MPKTLPSPSPLRKAVEISKFSKDHLLLATFCKINCLPSLLKVGASFGTTDKSGSSKPKITNLAFGRCSVAPGNGGFQLKIHRHRMIRFSGREPLTSLLTVSWSIHALTSLSLAFWKSFLCSSVRSFHLTSTRCFLAVVARRMNSAISAFATSSSKGRSIMS